MKHEKNTTLLALTTAALMLPGMAKKAEANTLDQKTTFDYKYSQYEEGDVEEDLVYGSPLRYSIDVHQFKFKTPLNEETELLIGGVQESMSGASPWYITPNNVDGKISAGLVMSGATIDESRNEMNIDFHSSYKDKSSTISTGFSSENDYRSFSLGYSGALRFNQNLSTIDYGFNTAKDYIDPTPNDTDDRVKNETKSRFGMLFGASHVFTKTTLVGVSVSYALLDGYLSDPYKLATHFFDPNALPVQVADSRPDTNEQIAWTLMWREFFEGANAALHADYRWYSSNWGIESNTLELAWYQNLGTGWQIIPSLRAYQQTQAAFYQPYYLAARADGFYSSDYRLSEFTAASGGMKIVKNFSSFSMNAAYEMYEATGDNPALISYEYFSAGFKVIF